MCALVAPAVLAQEATTQSPPAYRGVEMRVGGVFVTPVPNVPLTAIAELESTQALDDGSIVTKKTINNIARDSQGRIYNERRALVPENFTGVPELMSGHIYDPTTKLNTFFDPSTHLARQSIFSAPEGGAAGDRNLNRRGVQSQDLGTMSMENTVVHGVRTSRTISAAGSGTGKPIVVTDEYWYSDELHLNMLVKHDDPRTGTQTVTITHVNRSEPAEEMFQVPADYKVVDETPEQR
ncbi:MAG TPA: hypothetical protein VGD60_12940 [Candidatus Acidoferrales bacterium]